MKLTKWIKACFTKTDTRQRKVAQVRADFETWMKRIQPLAIHIMSFDEGTRQYSDETINRYWLGFMGARGLH